MPPPFLVCEALAQDTSINLMMHQHEHGVSKCLGCEHFVSGLSEYEGACCHQHRFISVDQNSAMHNCSLGEGLSIGSWRNGGTHDPNTVIYPTVPVFWGLISSGNRSLQVELEEIGSAESVSFNSSAR